MRTLLNAGKTLALGGAMLAVSALAYLHFPKSGPRSSDPYDNLADIGVGANAAVMMIVATGVALIALPFLLLPPAIEPSLRTRNTVYWLLVTLVPPAALLAVFIFT